MPESRAQVGRGAANSGVTSSRKARAASERFPPAPAAPDKPRSLREQLRFHEQAEEAAALPHTREEGCEQVRPAPRYSYGGPPAPAISAHVVGKRIVIRFEFNPLPSSPACRPFGLDVSVSSGEFNTPEYLESTQRFLVKTAAGSATVAAPARAQLPYTVRARAVTIDQRASREVRQRVR